MGDNDYLIEYVALPVTLFSIAYSSVVNGISVTTMIC
jgi:hypothetical protein